MLALFSLSTLMLAASSARSARAEPSELPAEIGYNYDEIETARTAGASGAVRAWGNSITALFTNPANMAASRVYHIGAFAQIWPEAMRQSYGAGAVDSVVSSSKVAGGVGATWNFQDNDGGIDREWTDVRVALAYPVSDRFQMGVGGRYMWLKQNGTGPLGWSLASAGLRDEQIVRGFTLDAGATLRPSQNFALALVGNNITNPDHGFQPTSAGGAIGVAFGDFSGEVDFVVDFTTWDHTTVRPMAALEALFVDHVAARMGYRYDSGAESHSLSLGVGYIDRSFDVDVGLRRVIVGDIATAIVVGFTYHLESTGLTPSPQDGF
jgi:hypothetical protein